MASKIEWTNETWQATHGCRVVSPGCTNCYAMRMAARLERMGQAAYAGLTTKTKAGAVWNGTVRAASDEALTKPLTWKKPRRIFVDSMADLFAEGVKDEWIDRAFAVMALCPQHTFQVLTKRPGRMRQYMTERWQPTKAQRIDFGGGDVLDIPAATSGETRRDQVAQACEEFIQNYNLADQTNEDHWTPEGSLKATGFAWPLPNVWLGTSAEDRARLHRIDDLRATPAALRFLSLEPLLEDLGTIDLTGIGWVIAGGESGPNARPMHPAWARSLRDQCAAAGVPFFFKQWGGWAPHRLAAGGDLGGDVRSGRVRIVHPTGQSDVEVFNETGINTIKGSRYMARVGKKAAGALLDGVEHKEFPR